MPPPRKPRKLSPDQLFEYAVNCLSARAYSSGDLRSKLRLRAALATDVDPVIARLLELGYLNDQRFAESYATLRRENDSFGRMRVLTDLRKHRIGSTLAGSAVEKAFEGLNEADLIDAFIERRMPAAAMPEGLSDERRLAAAYRKLRRAGFSSGLVLAALRKRAAKPEMVDDFPEEEAAGEEDTGNQSES